MREKLEAFARGDIKVEEVAEAILHRIRSEAMISGLTDDQYDHLLTALELEALRLS